MKRHLAALLGAILLLAVPAIALEIPASATSTGSSAAIAEDVLVEGELIGDLVVLAGESRISGVVRGDVVVWGGELTLEPGARIDGSLMAVATRVVADPEAVIEGRFLLWNDLAELAGTALGREAATDPGLLRRWLWGFRLLSLLLWLSAAVLISVLGRQVLERSVQRIRQMPLATFLAGTAAFFAALLLAWALLGWSGSVAMVLLALLALAAVAGKVFGMAAVFVVIGRVVVDRLAGRGPTAGPVAITVGLLVLGALRYLPGLGSPVWLAASLVGFGAAVIALLGPSSQSISAS